MKKYLKASIILISLALSAAVFARLYVWIDEKGITHISDKPPFGHTEPAEKSESKKADEDDEAASKEAETAFKSGDYAKALALLTPLAERGNPRAQNGLGMLYSRGLGVPKDLYEGFRWHQKAALQGYGLAQYYLGLMYADGQGVLRDAAEAARWLRKAAEQGLSNAQFTLGVMYAKGEGVEKDSRQAAEWYRRAAEQGNALAQHNLALLYASGEGVAQNLAEAFRWQRKAAEQGDRNAQYRLGLLYAKGEDGVPQSYSEAFKWIRKAIGQGYPLRFDFEPGWTVGDYQELPNQYATMEFIREGDNIKYWKELLTIQNFPPFWGGPTPQDALNRLKALREKECPAVTKWNVISQNDNSVLYEWQAKRCRSWPVQHEIARIIYGKYNTFILHYTLKTYQMPGEQRARWIKRFADAG